MDDPVMRRASRGAHDVGSEEAWSAERGVDAKSEAERLLHESGSISSYHGASERR
jgi:hypothetical protein